MDIANNIKHPRQTTIVTMTSTIATKSTIAFTIRHHGLNAVTTSRFEITVCASIA
ncbi:hypothetical protein [Lysinibacillus fusiformis]|uniref:hypothetical protein n=1 Tax=Lysinibacillus fusiformis TaxID=28031 RepID=UPI0038676058